MSKEHNGWLPPFTERVRILGPHRVYRIIDEVQKADLFRPAEVMLPNGELDTSGTLCGADIATIHPDSDIGQKTRRKLIKNLRYLNLDYNFDLFEPEDPLLVGAMYITRYTDQKQIGLPPHVDVGGFPGIENRKLTVVIPLNSPYHYEGGRLMIQDGKDHNAFGENWTPQIREGSAIVFPSFRMHYVTPVTRDTRFVLTTFLQGPRFR